MHTHLAAHRNKPSTMKSNATHMRRSSQRATGHAHTRRRTHAHGEHSSRRHHRRRRRSRHRRWHRRLARPTRPTTATPTTICKPHPASRLCQTRGDTLTDAQLETLRTQNERQPKRALGQPRRRQRRALQARERLRARREKRNKNRRRQRQAARLVRPPAERSLSERARGASRRTLWHTHVCLRPTSEPAAVR